MTKNETSIEVLRPETHGNAPKGRLNKLKTIFTVTLGLLIFGLALYFIRRELSAYSLESIIQSVRSIPTQNIMLAGLATLLSFAGISCYDYLALKYTDKKIPLRQTVFASFCAYAISNTLGLSVLTGNAVRYRLYSSWGLGALDVAIIALVTTGFLFFSSLSVMALGFILDGAMFEQLFKIPEQISVALGVSILCVIFFGLYRLVTGPEVFEFRKISINRPSLSRVALQFLVGVLDWVAAAAVLYFLLSATIDFSFWVFVPIFIAALYLGAMSGLPGGIGVFEAIFLILAPSGSKVDVAAALVAYRAIYYIFPLLISVVLMTAHQAGQSKAQINKGRERAGDFLEVIAPSLYAVLTFVVGAVMLVSATTPSILDEIEFVAKLVPLPVIQVSHLIASAVGTLLLLAAMGLKRRLRNGWIFTIALFSSGALFTLLKGGSQAGVLIMLFLASGLYFAKDAFYRKGRISQIRLSLVRSGLIIGTVTAAIGAGFYAYQKTDYAASLWWDFGLEADASRFLRSGLIIVAILFVYFIWRLLAPPPALQKADNSPEFLEKVRAIIDTAEGAASEVNLALLGDKQFLFSESGKSFIMYGVKGRNWVAMGEPVGLESERKELMWEFRNLADMWDSWPSFYSVRPDNLGDFVDLGFTVQKIGEMALVPVKDFTLEGPQKAKFRHAKNKGIREGLSFEVIQPSVDSDDMKRLKAVSDSWLNAHQGKEKGFSLGRFDAQVLSRQSIAVVRKDSIILAFANLWMTSDKEEFSLDLMRYENIGVNGIMDYLFAEIMVWGGAQGFNYFSLGMAPLSGLEAHKLAPLMSKIGSMIFKYGGKIYGFEGLRAFKQKFNPKWEPVYLAAPSQMVIPQALGNLALLSSGGILGLILRER